MCVVFVLGGGAVLMLGSMSWTCWIQTRGGADDDDNWHVPERYVAGCPHAVVLTRGGADLRVMAAIHMPQSKAWVPAFAVTGYLFGGRTHGGTSMRVSGHVVR